MGKEILTDFDIEKNLEEYKSSLSVIDGREKSWEHCYDQFLISRQRNNYDYNKLALHLAFYLASWGMYRGSSFLLQKDYTVHIETIKIVLERKYDVLFGGECSVLINSVDRIFEITDRIKEHYRNIRAGVKPNVSTDISDILITKILLGTLGCVPVYDEYFVQTIKKYGVARGTYNKTSLIEICQFYEENKELLEKKRNGFVMKDRLYPQMKILDMLFWQLGKES